MPPSRTTRDSCSRRPYNCIMIALPAHGSTHMSAIFLFPTHIRTCPMTHACPFSPPPALPWTHSISISTFFNIPLLHTQQSIHIHTHTHTHLPLFPALFHSRLHALQQLHQRERRLPSPLSLLLDFEYLLLCCWILKTSFCVAGF